MSHPPLLSHWIDRPHRESGIGDLPLVSGEVLRDCHLSWVEHGRRNTAGDNTIVGMCAIGSTHHRLDFLIGPGRALDTKHFHVLVIDALGNGLSSSPSNSSSQRDNAFPRITIRDMVESQRRLLDQLGIRSHWVIGASMGAMQALQWAACHPGRVRGLVAMTAGARTARWSQLVNEISRRCLFEDAEFTRPRERRAALALWAPFAQMVVPLSPATVENITSQQLLMQHVRDLERRYLGCGPSAFDWLAQLRAYDAHCIPDEAVRDILCPALLLAPPLDLYNPSEGPRETAAAMPGARFLEIPSNSGHRAASESQVKDSEFLNRAIADFLEEHGSAA